MKKNIWVLNHYATNMFFDEAGRHYWFADNLKKKDYQPIIFCATTNHFSDKHIDTKGKQYAIKSMNGIPFVFINTSKYSGNRMRRIINMFDFYRGLFKTTRKYKEYSEKPDLILASSVHPLTLVAGIKIAKKFNIPCICEIRDLWPESIVAYGSLKRKGIIAKALYLGEKWIYRNADSIIMTWAGGKQYIIDQGWENSIDLRKVKHISNGVEINAFDNNSIEYKVMDSDLEDDNFKNLVYAGSIRKVNNLGVLLDAAKIIQDSNSRIRFLIYGSGGEKEMLENRCTEENINNVIFKGRVEKRFIPSILKKSYANILHNSSTSLDKYGQSQNKFFEYLAAGKCIIQTYSTKYNILDQHNCGVVTEVQTPKEIAKLIIDTCNDDDKVEQMGLNAREAAKEFDFTKLTNDLIDEIEKDYNC